MAGPKLPEGHLFNPLVVRLVAFATNETPQKWVG